MKRGCISKTTNIIGSFRILKGNTRISVLFEPMWGIPFVMFNFYLSLYMKELGVTNQQIGYLISIGFISGTVFSLFAGVITDRLGRRKTTLIFDFISWPFCILIYTLSNSFLLFALATVANNVTRIVGVSWNMMIIEDADNEQRLAAYNLIGIINIATGVIIPLAGIIVNIYGVVSSERIFLVFAFISMSAMIILRNRLYKETSTGKRILEENRLNPVKNSFKSILPLKAAVEYKKNPVAILVFLLYILFNAYLPLGTINSLYFVPYMTEVMDLDESSVSILGGVYSAAMFVVFVFIVPLIGRFSKTANLIVGLLIQVASILLLILIPSGSLLQASVCIILFALGFGIFRPFIDLLFAEVTEGRERAGIYSIVFTFTCVVTALIGFVSGSIYAFNPRLIYIMSIAILLICILVLLIFEKIRIKQTDMNTIEE